MADSSHNDFIVDDYIDDYYEDTETIVIIGVFDIDVGAPGSQRHRTALASQKTMDLVAWPSSSPWAPFDAEPVFVLSNHIGLYAFGRIAIPDALLTQNAVFHTEATLLEVSPITFAATPIGANLLGSVSAGQRPTGTVTLRNVNSFWDLRVNDEAWLAMGSGLFMIIRQLYTVPILTGVVGRMRLVEDTVVIDYGAFKREQPAPGERIWFI